LFDLSGPACTGARQDVECGCSECFSWSASPGANWYEVRRCDPSGSDCTIVGDTRFINHAAFTDNQGVFHPAIQPTLWCVPWDGPFPKPHTGYDYSVRACANRTSGTFCSTFSAASIGYTGAPYLCLDNGIEIPCRPSTPPPPGFATDFDGDGITDAVDLDDDGDGIPDRSDNCPLTANIGQRDIDRDGVGDACDPSPKVPGATPTDADRDGISDRDDVCPRVSDPLQTDTDHDGTGDACDNCPSAANEMQSDEDDDRQGDRCDLDDGTIYAVWSSRTQLAWAPEVGYTTWCVYRGDLAVLRSSGTYTQAPGSNPLASRSCALASGVLADTVTPAAGKTAFYLVGGRPGSWQNDLGFDSAGQLRPNANPCP
jgi:hypothetical protein